jgi:ATP-dependent RNA helicase DOB1
MSGRAGRRGKDDRGIVIQMLDEKMDPAVCKDILYGNPDPLNSSYRISYNMLLNLMRVEDVDPEYLLRASFHQFQREEEAPALLAQADDLQSDADAMKNEFPSLEVHDLVGQYYGMDQQLLANRRRISKVIQQPEHCLRFLTPGRLVDVSIDGKSYGWGKLVACRKKSGSGAGGEHGRLADLASGPEHTIDVLLNCIKETPAETGKAEDEEDSSVKSWKGFSSDCRPVNDRDAGKASISMRIFTLGLDSIDRISAVKCVLPQAYTTVAARRKVQNVVAEVVRRMKENPSSVPLLDPVVDLGIKSEEFTTIVKRAEMLTDRMASHKLATDYKKEDRDGLLATYEKKTLAIEKAKLLRAEAASFQTMAMRGQLKNMKRVLRKLGHVNNEGVIQTKGRTACEISTADELVVVEMIFAGVFNDLSVEQCVALLSAMTYDERNKDEDDPCSGMRSFLVTPFRKLQDIARTVVRVELSCGLQVDEDEFVQHFNPGM